jgi:DNA-binding MarR family transcriptional regulator
VTYLPGTPTCSAQAVRALARASRLLERASPGANLSQYRVLSAIAEGDQRASRIAARLAVGKPAISATVDSLCQAGWLARSSVEGDQRVAALRLTEEGGRALARMEGPMVAWVDDLCARAPDGEQLLQALVGMGTALDRLAAERHGRTSTNQDGL